MKEYQIYVSLGVGCHIFNADRDYLAKNALVIGQTSKRILTDKAVADIVKYGFKSVTIREGYFIDIVVG